MVTAGPDPKRDAEFEAHVLLGGELLRGDDVDAARAEFRAALALRPGDVRALGLMGLACFRANAFDEALGVYRALVEARPTDASFRLNLGLVLLKLGDARGAIVELGRCRELDPSQSRTVGYLGLAFARVGQYGQAYEAFLGADQPALAREMEQYLAEPEREAIRTRVAEAARAGSPPPVVAREARASAPPPVAPAAVSPAPLFAAAHATPPAPPPARAAIADAEVAVTDDLITEDHERVATTGEMAAVEAEVGADSRAYEAVVREGAAASDPTAPAPIEADAGRPAYIGPQGMITQALAVAAPSETASRGAARVAMGHVPPRPIGEWATERLIRPDDGDGALELSDDGALVVRVAGRILSRTEGVVASGGDLAFEPATRRVRGAASDEPFGDGAQRMFVVSGQGFLVAAPGDGRFAALSLDDDIVYLREDLVFAFEERLRWESGHVPGSSSTINVVQFRGQGVLAVLSPRPLASIKLGRERLVYVDASALAGWVGRVVPRLTKPAAGGAASTPFVECSGEGVVLFEPPGPR